MKYLKKKRVWLAAVLAVWILWANTAPEANGYTICSSRIPAEFSGYRIVHLSDVHNAAFGEKILVMIREADPDIIVITGDLVDSRRTDVDAALELVQKAVQIAPVYYVTGNHESRIPDDYEQLKTGMEDAGVTILENESICLEREGASVTLIGLHDPTFSSFTAHALENLAGTSENYNILLSHRPEQFGLYADCGIDLVFTGHAHGGQFRIPFVGGLVAPHQGWFPEYDAGLFTRERTNMIVSRGIGNSICPIRINNRPEIIVVKLESQ